jgi:hypothetical protein
MKPLLTHSNPTLMETLPACCLPLGRILTSTEQLMRHPAMINDSIADFNQVIIYSILSFSVCGLHILTHVPAIPEKYQIMDKQSDIQIIFLKQTIMFGVQTILI